MEKPRALRHLAWHLTFERRSDKSVELRGFEPLTFCMPCRRATSCAIAPQPTRTPFGGAPFGGTWIAYRVRGHVSYLITTTSARRRRSSATAAPARQRW